MDATKVREKVTQDDWVTADSRNELLKIVARNVLNEQLAGRDFNHITPGVRGNAYSLAMRVAPIVAACPDLTMDLAAEEDGAIELIIDHVRSDRRISCIFEDNMWVSIFYAGKDKPKKKRHPFKFVSLQADLQWIRG